MDDKLDLHGHLSTRNRLKLLWHQIAFCAAGIRYTMTLLRFAYKDMQVLWRFRRLSGPERSRWSWEGCKSFLSEFHVSLQQCLELFVPLHLARASADKKEDQYNDGWYKRFYRELRARSSSPFDLAPNTPARTLQAALLRYTFHRLLGIVLSPTETYILAGRGGVTVMMRELLEFCGCPEIPLHRTYLTQQMPIFLAYVRENEQERLEQKKWLIFLERHLSGLRFSQILFSHPFWTLPVSQQTSTSKSEVVRIYQEAQREGLLKKHDLSMAMQAGLVIVLAKYTDIRAKKGLVDILCQGEGEENIGEKEIESFQAAVSSLDMNFMKFRTKIEKRR